MLRHNLKNFLRPPFLSTYQKISSNAVLNQRTVGSILSTESATIPSVPFDTTVRNAAQLMFDRKLVAVPVVKDLKVVSISVLLSVLDFHSCKCSFAGFLRNMIIARLCNQTNCRRLLVMYRHQHLTRQSSILKTVLDIVYKK